MVDEVDFVDLVDENGLPGREGAHFPEPGARGFCGRLADFFYLDEVLYLELAVIGMAGTSTRAGF